MEQRSNAPRDATGWDGCLDQLEAVIVGKPREPGARQGFAALYAEYVRSFGAGAFPSFLSGPSSASSDRTVHALLPNPAMQGRVFESASGAQLATLEASRDAETHEHLLEGAAQRACAEAHAVVEVSASPAPGSDSGGALPGGGCFRLRLLSRSLCALSAAGTTAATADVSA